MKWARISEEEEHEDVMSESFRALLLISTALDPEIAEITPEAVELSLSTDKSPEIMSMCTFQIVRNKIFKTFILLNYRGILTHHMNILTIPRPKNSISTHLLTLYINLKNINRNVDGS